MFAHYLDKMNLEPAKRDAVLAIRRACLEQVASDVNRMPRGNSLSGAYQVGFDTDEWFPVQTVSDEIAERAKDAQMGYRIGRWNGAGRSVVGINRRSPENICASTTGNEATA